MSMENDKSTLFTPVFSTTTDEIILHKMAKNFEEGFHLLFITYYHPLIRVARRMIGSDFAEDVVQDTFTMVWHNKYTFDTVVSLKSYLYTSIHNKCLNVIRKENIAEKYKAEYHTKSTFEESILDEEVFAQLYQALELLPEHYKEAMVKTLDGESIADIALSMDTTEDSIKAYKRRAKQILKKELAHLNIFSKRKQNK